MIVIPIVRFLACDGTHDLHWYKGEFGDTGDIQQVYHQETAFGGLRTYNRL